MDDFAGRVYVEGEELVLRGYDDYLTKKQQGEILNNIIAYYPKHQRGENFGLYLQGVAHALEATLNARVMTIIEKRQTAKLNKESWNQFPRQRANFTTINPMRFQEILNREKPGKTTLYNMALAHQNKAKHMVFPVAARKTRRNRRSSRKSRR
jgi:hypothetical protein